MKPEDMKNLPKAPEGISLLDAIKVACIAFGAPMPEEDDDYEENDDYEKEAFDENGRPRYILCDEIWDILAEAGHGAEVIIQRDKPETIYYNDFATQLDNVHFMSYIAEALDNGCLVTVNGKDIYDLY